MREITNQLNSHLSGTTEAAIEASLRFELTDTRSGKVGLPQRALDIEDEEGDDGLITCGSRDTDSQSSQTMSP